MQISQLKALIFDLDGVIWRGETAIPGAAEAVAAFRARGLKCFFATNNSGRTAQFFADKLRGVGVACDESEIVTSSTATALYVKTHFPPGVSIYVVGEDGIQQFLREIGAQIYTESSHNLPENVDLVIVGIDREFSYAKLRRAQAFILAGAKFIATNRDATFPIEGGVTPGAGSIVAAVEVASGIVPVSMGKPQPAMLELILELHGLQKHEAAMIGDRLDTDIACAHNAGIGKIFVATGVTKMEEAKNASGAQRADLFLENLGELLL